VSAGVVLAREGSELVSKKKALSIRTARSAGRHPAHHTTFAPAAALIMANCEPQVLIRPRIAARARIDATDDPK